MSGKISSDDSKWIPFGISDIATGSTLFPNAKNQISIISHDYAKYCYVLQAI